MRVIPWAAVGGPGTVRRTPWAPWAIINRPAPMGVLVGWLVDDVCFSPDYVRFAPRSRHSGDIAEGPFLPSRPGEFHPGPLTEPDVIGSIPDQKFMRFLQIFSSKFQRDVHERTPAATVSFVRFRG